MSTAQQQSHVEVSDEAHRAAAASIERARVVLDLLYEYVDHRTADNVIREGIDLAGALLADAAQTLGSLDEHQKPVHLVAAKVTRRRKAARKAVRR
jgi:hypothetical protein